MVAAFLAAAPADARPSEVPGTLGDTLSDPSTRVPVSSQRRAHRRPAVRRPEVRRTPVEGRPIRRITIVAHDVYDPVPPTRLAALHRLANRMHFRTRERTVRSQLLFREGDPWSEKLGRETARNLRALDFLDPRRVEARGSSDSVEVLVETRDLWTTSPEINIESGGGRNTGSLGFTERNLLGLGKSVSLLYREDAIGVTRHLSFDDPAVFGSRHELHVGGGKSAEGASAQARIGVPFYAEETPRTYGVSWNRTTYVAHLFQRGSEVASIDERLEEGSLWFGGRVPTLASIARLTGSLEFEDRRRGPTRLQPGASTAFAGDEEVIRRRMVALKLRLWQPRYVELEDINRMDRVEDFDLGTSATFKLGASAKFLGGSVDEGHVEFGLDAGTLTGAGFGVVRGSVSGWVRPSPSDVVARVDGRWYFLPPGHTIVLGALGIAGSNVSRDFQVSIGGLNGLRAYPVNEVTGRQAWRMNAEDRWIFSPEDWTFVKIASAVFYDAARAWGAGAGGIGWHHDAGVGLRLAVPQFGLSQVLRIDVAWPISPSRDGRRTPVLSFGSNQAF